MNPRAIANELLNAHGGELQIACGEAHTLLSQLVGQLKDVECSVDVLKSELRPITVMQAHAIVWSVLHKSMAYHSEYMPAEQAMQLAWCFVDAFGRKASFFSTTVPPDDPRDVISSWGFVVSSHTFEAFLCCRGEQASALVLATDED
jgi:hypothetical protein